MGGLKKQMVWSSWRCCSSLGNPLLSDVNKTEMRVFFQIVLIREWLHFCVIWVEIMALNPNTWLCSLKKKQRKEWRKDLTCFKR